jgi:protein tyrosine/serine phosphatase/predicted nucleotidyltransferase
MKQIKTIEKVKQIISNVKGVEVALLYGSFGRNEGNPNSDIDIQLLVDEIFQPQNLTSILKKEFKDEIQFITEVNLRNKVVVYFIAQPKIEFGICRSIEEINRNYLGSEITCVLETILFANKGWTGIIDRYLQELVSNCNKEKTVQNGEKHVLNLIDKFVYEYENCSNLHRRSDGFQFYFYYNIALHVAVQLYYLSTGETKYNFLPKNFLSRILGKEEERNFRELKGTLFLPEANQQKRKLLDFFYISIKNLVSQEKQEELKTFLEWIYSRDFLWNFRDVSTNNPYLKSGIVYRTSTMILFQDETFFTTFLNEKKIKTVVDLRTEKEILDLPYNEKSLKIFNYVKAPFDPWNQSIEFQTTYHYGSNIEIAYRYFGIECKESIKSALESIINEPNATAIHCHAGKDRTGILVTFLHLLSGADLEIAYTDYLATEMDTRKEYLDIVLDIVNEKGGIVPYLIECGLHETQIKQLKNKLLDGF